MRLLIIGGTRFVGYHMAVEAVARGHQVTVFHRGQTGDVPAGAAELKGDRTGDLAVLRGPWDAVLDTCGYVPSVVRHSAELLREVPLYAFVSTVSVYELPAAPGATEAAQLKAPVSTEPMTPETYGALKVACERVVEEVFPGRALFIRPGIVVGPRDTTDRFTSWVVKKDRGGEFEVPAPAERPVQWIDARDLAAWTIQAIERGLTGPYHLVTPPTTMGAFLEAAPGPGRPVWVELEEEEAEEYPFYTGPEERNILALDPAKAIAAGLTYRPLAETVRDILAG